MNIWSAVGSLFQKSGDHFKDFMQIIEVFYQKCEDHDFCIFVEIARRIWLRRNRWIHEGLFTHPNEMASVAKRAVEEFQNIRLGAHSNLDESNEWDQRWENPPLGWIKVNCDAVLDVKQGLMGMGFVLRDHGGMIRVARSITQQGFLGPASAEALAVFLAIQLCQSSGVQKIIVEGDAQTIINDINKDGKQESRYRHIIDDIKILLLSLTEWRAQHV